MLNIAENNLIIKRGDTFGYTLDFTGSAVDLTGAVLNAQAKRNANSNDVVFEWVDVPITSNTADFTKQPAETANYPVGSFVYDIELTLADGTVRTIIKGTITVEQDVTRR